MLSSSMRRIAALRTISYLALIVALAIVVSSGLAPHHPTLAFAPEQILPVYHFVPIDGAQVVHFGADTVGAWASWTPLSVDAPDGSESLGAWTVGREQPDIGWRDLFLTSRYNSKYKDQPVPIRLQALS